MVSLVSSAFTGIADIHEAESRNAVSPAVILFFFIRTDSHVLRVVLRILLIPVISGVSYEIIRLAGNSNNPLIRLISKPGLWMQLMTTKEPDDDMIRVGIASVEAVFDWKSYLSEDFGYIAQNPDIKEAI